MTITATCSTCGTHYTFAQNKIPHGVTSTKCSKCGNVIPLQVNTPITPPPLPKECPKCGYLHQPQDDRVSERECPRCGVIYEKYETFLQQKQHENTPEKEKNGGKNIMEENTIHTTLNGSYQQPSSPLAHQRMGEILGAAILLGIAGNYLLRTFPWGINATLFICLLTGIILWEWRRFQEKAACVELLLAGCLLCLFLAWRDANALKVLNVTGAGGILILLCARPTRHEIYAGTLLALLVNSIRTVLKSFLVALFQLVFKDIQWARHLNGAIDVPIKHHGALKKIIRALLFTLPLVIIFTWLFASADEKFKEIILNWFDWSGRNSHHLLHHLIWIVIIFALAATVLKTLVFGPYWLTVDATPPGALQIGALEVASVLSSLITLFAIFIFVQFRYWFGGDLLIRIIPELTYAGYLHKGFYQLLAVGALLHLILLVGAWLVNAADHLTNKLFQVLSVPLILLNYFVLASAFFRLHIYINAYGLTVLRFYAAAILGWLGVVFLLFLGKLLKPTWTTFTGAYMYSVIAAILALNLINPDALIARINLERARQGKQLDIQYLWKLSADAVPVILHHQNRLTEHDRMVLISQINRKNQAYAQGNWRSWNYSRSRALRLLSSQLARKE
jgi:hypothetical protein